MRIAFIHDWEPDIYQEFTWKDGLAASIRILSTKHQVRFFTLGKQKTILPHEFFPITICENSGDLLSSVGQYSPDVILHWGDCTRPNASVLYHLEKPMALCFAGGDPMGPTNKFFDHFFVESAVYEEEFRARGFSVSRAFGVNTEIFRPLPDMKKQFDTLFPATYCEWKRHYLFRGATQGLRSATAGFMYSDHERDCWEDTMKSGVFTLPHVSAETLRALYAASSVVVVTSKATGGSQRTILEAMAMNCPVVVTSDCRGAEYLRDAEGLGYSVGLLAEPNVQDIREKIDKILNSLETYLSGRTYIELKWTEKHYASALEDGIKSIL